MDVILGRNFAATLEALFDSKRSRHTCWCASVAIPLPKTEGQNKKEARPHTHLKHAIVYSLSETETTRYKSVCGPLPFFLGSSVTGSKIATH